MKISLVPVAIIAAVSLALPAQAATTFYTGASGKTAFLTDTAAFTTTTEGFEGITTPHSNGIGSVGYGTVFSRDGLTVTDSGAASTLTVLDNTYVNGGNQIRNRFGASTGSVLDAGYGSLTIDFATAVNSFGIDLATIARGFVGGSSGTFTLFGAGGTQSYNYSGNSGFGFLGLVSDTAFTSVTIAAGRANDDEFDNIITGIAPAVVPEPASWAMMLVGFGVAGFGMRRRQTRFARTI